MRNLVLLGAGGHARVIIEIVRMNREYEISGVVSPVAPPDSTGVPWLGDDRVLPQLRHDGVTHFIVAVGSTGPASPRRKLYEQAGREGLQPASAIHPRAIVSPTATLELGTVVMAGAMINAHARVGENVIINTGAVVEHDCSVAAHAHVATRACLCGGVCVGEDAHIGAGATIRQSLAVGAGAVVAAGAVVVHDVEAGTMVKGVPARRCPADMNHG